MAFSRWSRPLTALLAVLAVLVGAAGCSPTATIPTVSADPTTSAASQPPTVVPAGGPELVMGPVSLRVPEGWSEPQNFKAASVSTKLDSCGVIELANMAAPEVTLANMVTAYGTGSEWTGVPERLPDPTIAGAQWFHLHGQNGADADATGADVQLYGTYRVDRIVTIRLERTTKGTCRIAEADLAGQWTAVLATVHWI